ncbi:hypothetical protein [Endozoicomonas sp. 2B-B]
MNPLFKPMDRLLEEWAGWRITYEIYEGTGDSPVSRLLNPAPSTTPGSRILWSGAMNSQLSALNKALIGRLGVYYTTVTAILYGTSGTDRQKAKALRLSYSTLSRLRKKARLVASAFIEGDLIPQPEVERNRA